MDYYISNLTNWNKPNTILLWPDNWDDYSFRTTFQATYVDPHGISKQLGSVKIGVKKAAVGEYYFYTKELLPEHFDKLPEGFFSLWQSADTYQMLRKINEECGCNIFKDLNDVAYDLELCKRYWEEPIMQNSLTRSVNLSTIENQFHRITLGRAKLTKYNFAYEIDPVNSGATLTFDVIPNSLPPTNIHVLIGGNGIGKTTLIREMIKEILGDEIELSLNRFVYDYSKSMDQSAQFANVICVAFSPFDDFSLLERFDSKKFSYIGTQKKYRMDNALNNNEEVDILKDIERQFIDSLRSCLGNLTKREDLIDVINILENDPVFHNYRISELIVNKVNKGTGIDYEDMSPFKDIFAGMSSGHKVVLSIIVRCIDKIVEKTVLFLDEPENHLHPPLVSSLIRSISTVLTKRNGVAIISTHSPIVLQETPKSCVWILARNGDVWKARRPRFETFGENVGSLTNDVFRYEISNSGFHALLKNSVRECKSFEEVVEAFNYQLGDEARGLVQNMLLQKERNEL